MSGAQDRPERWFDTALFGAACMLCLGVSVGAALVGRTDRTAWEQQAAQDEAAENRTVCERLAAASGSERFVTCVVELDGVRAAARQRSKLLADAYD